MKLFNPLMIAGLVGGNVGLLIAIAAVAVIVIGILLFAKCTVTYIDPENDEEISTEKFAWLSKVAIPDAKKENKRFLGWSLNARGTAPIGKERLRLRKSVVLYAVWDENYGTLCEFDANAVLEFVYVNAKGEEIKTESHPVKVVLPETDAKIIGWAFDENGKPVFDSNPETNTVLSVKLYPVYEESAEEPVVEEVAEEVAEEVIEEAVAEETEEAAPEVVEETVEEIEAEEPVEEPVAEEIIEEPVVEEIVEEPVAEEVQEEVAPTIIPSYIDSFGNQIDIKYSRSIKANVIQADDTVKSYYSAIKNHILSYKGVKSRFSWKFDSFNKGRDQLFKLKIRGKTICLYCALNPYEFDKTKYHHEAIDAKIFEAVPMLVKIKSGLGLKKAKELVDIEMAKLGIELDPKFKEVDYVSEYPYEETDALVQKKLIKVLVSDVNTVVAAQPKAVEDDEIEEVVEPVIEETVEEPVVEEPVVEEIVEEVIEEPVVEEVVEEAIEEEEEEIVPVIVPSYIDSFGNKIDIKYSRSIKAKVIQTDDTVKEYYSAIKNHILSYKGVKSRFSWKFDSFNKGREQLFKLKIRGKTLCLYCALNPYDFDKTRYHHEAVDAKIFEAVPMLVKIKSGLGLKKAKELVDIEMAKFGIELDPKFKEVDYVSEYPYEETDALVQKKLIKVLAADADVVVAAQPKVVEEDEIEEVLEPVIEEIVEEPVVEEVAEEVVEEVIEEPVVEEIVEEAVEEAVEEPVIEEIVEETEEEAPISEEVFQEDAPTEEPTEDVIEETETVEEANDEPVQEVEEVTEEVIEEPIAEEVVEEVVEEPVIEEVHEPAKTVEEIQYVESISAEEVDDLVVDEVVESLVEEDVEPISKTDTKKAIINIDTLSKEFNDGDVVDLATLKAKKLIDKNAKTVKVLSRGSIDKKLTVRAGEFSKTALKMIVLTGGTAVHVTYKVK